MNDIQIELGCLPVVMVTLRGLAPDEAYQRYLRDMGEMMATKQSLIAIVDGRQSEMNSPKHARMQATWLREQRPALEALDFGTVLVIDRPIVRFSLSAMLAFAPIPGTYKVVSTLADGAAWAAARLRARGRTVPPALTRFASSIDTMDSFKNDAA